MERLPLATCPVLISIPMQYAIHIVVFVKIIVCIINYIHVVKFNVELSTYRIAGNFEGPMLVKINPMKEVKLYNNEYAYHHVHPRKLNFEDWSSTKIGSCDNFCYTVNYLYSILHFCHSSSTSVLIREHR